MQEITLSQLRMARPPGQPILHPSGIVILRADEPLTPQVLNVLEDENLEFLVVPQPGESLDEVRFQLTYTTLSPEELHTGKILQSALYDQDNHLLLEAGTPVTPRFKETLQRRGIKQILVRRNENTPSPESAQLLREALLLTLRQQAPTPEMDLQSARESISEIPILPAADEDFTPQILRAKINQLNVIDYVATGESFSRSVRDTRKITASSEEKEELSELSGDCLRLTEEILEWFTTSRDSQVRGYGPLPLIEKVVSGVLAGVIKHKDIISLCSITQESKDYLANHSLAVCVVSALVGQGLGFNASQVKALSYGALLADVGMLRVPMDIRAKPGPLDDYERARVRCHPALGLDLLSRVRGLPAEVPWIVYQSHERQNGSGYPCGKSGRVIHSLAKVVGVADIFVAMCAARPYREPHIPYKVVETLLQMVNQKLFDSIVVRAFLSAQSLFPIGSLLLLNDGRIAQVVASNPEIFTRPVVALLTEAGGKVLSEPQRLDMSKHPEITVSKPLPTPSTMSLRDRLKGF